MKHTVIAVVGPTAVGKTSLSVEIAKRFNGEIISGDSMQIYKGMNIGTAKVTEEEKKGIPHHMVDIKKPEESFSVADFQTHVRDYIEDISARGRIPIIAGGTGLYIQAALTDYQFSDTKRDEAYQKKIEQEIEKKGVGEIYQRLKKADPTQAEKIHPNNTRRLIRALEVFERTGKTITESHINQVSDTLYETILIGLTMDRELLYERINKRIDHMIEHGLINEVSYFYEQGLKDAQSMKAIGYKEFIPYFQNEKFLKESVELLKRNSRRYAKRQFTWFKNKMDIDWYDINEQTKEEKFQIILRDIAGKLREK